MRNAIEWLLAAVIVGGAFAAIPITGNVLALWAFYTLPVLIGGR